MAKIKIALFVLSEVLAAIDGLARSLAQSRSEVMRAALDIGVEFLQQRQSGKAGPPETASRLVPGSSRPSRPRRETLWHCPRPRDWKVGDVLYERAQRILEERPNWERTAFKKKAAGCGERLAGRRSGSGCRAGAEHGVRPVGRGDVMVLPRYSQMACSRSEASCLLYHPSGSRSGAVWRLLVWAYSTVQTRNEGGATTL